MNTNNNQNTISQIVPSHSEVRLSDILQILKKRKFILMITLSVSLMLAGLYSFFSTPIYEATTLIKKEKIEKDYSQDEFKKITQMYTTDEVETEIEVLKTRTIYDKVIHELSLFFNVKQVALQNASVNNKEMLLAEYLHHLDEMPDNRLPRLQVIEFKPSSNFKTSEFSLKISNDKTLILYDENENILLKKESNIWPIEIKYSIFHLSIYWPNAKPGNAIYFRIENPETTFKKLFKSTFITAIRKTSVFKLSVRSSSSYMAQLITNKIAEKFRETRLEHKRQIIHYSYDFVNRQLAETSEKLRKAEAELSEFKSKHRIMMIDETSKENIDFLSSLEAEKNKINLELAEYRNRYGALKYELRKKGYFDQTFLTPNENDRIDSPFSTLLQQLSNAELERLELLQKRTSQHPDVKAINKRIEEIKEKLSKYNQNTLTAYKIIINSLNEKLKDLNGLIEKYTKSVERLPEHETKLMNLTREKDVHEKIFKLLLDKREEMHMAELSKLQDIVIVDPALAPIKPVLPKKLFNLIIGFVLGMMIGIVLIFLKEFQSKTIQNFMEIEKDFRIPILAMLPEYNRLIKKKIKNGFHVSNHIAMLTDNSFGFKESYRVMRTKLPQLLHDGNMILFTSCEENSGKTTILSNFAISSAIAGKKILVVDCDLKKPKLGEFFQISHDSIGIIDFLTNGSASPNIYNSYVKTGDMEIQIDIIPSGGQLENSSELLDSPKLKTFFKEISQHYDFIFIDTPPATITVDSLVLGNYIKNLILIVKPNLTHKKSLERAMQEFNQFGIKILGCVINGHDLYYLQNGYGYSYGFKYNVSPSMKTES
ncbi:MAG: GumC family protein [Candidatus Hodarchaeota archaeon]